jgi:predicted ester cyclase
MVRVVIEGTHAGFGLGVPPSGRRIRVAGIVVIRVSKGQFVEGWNSGTNSGSFDKSARCQSPRVKTSF